MGLGKSIIGGCVGIAGLVGVLTLGPIDLPRTIFGVITGDIPALKQELVGYVSRDIKSRYPSFTQDQLDSVFCYKFDTPCDDGFNPQDAGIIDLWDASEDHARSWYQGWVWPSLNSK